MKHKLILFPFSLSPVFASPPNSLFICLQQYDLTKRHIHLTQLAWSLSSWYRVPLFFLWSTIRKSSYNICVFRHRRSFTVSKMFTFLLTSVHLSLWNMTESLATFINESIVKLFISHRDTWQIVLEHFLLSFLSLSLSLPSYDLASLESYFTVSTFH